MALPSLLKQFQAAFDGHNAHKLVENIYSHSRWITHSRYKASVRYCAQEMKKAGLKKVEVLEFPIDGKRLYGNWKSPLYWDVTKAWLDIRINGRWERFADFREIPHSIFVYCAPTRGKVSTRLVAAGSGRLKGNLVFGDPTDENLAMIRKKGALGIVTDFAPNWEGVREEGDFREGRRWDNSTLAENPDKLAGFSLSRNQGVVLREALAREKSVECRFRVDGRLGKGTFLCVTGTIPGKRHPDEEVLSVAHLYETGANDNCSGVAASIEALSAIRRLAAKGVIRPPERTIRVVFAFEIVGFLAYFSRMKKRGRKYTAAINPDMVGENQALCRSVLNIYQAPDSTPSFVNPLIISLMNWAAGSRLKTSVKKFIVNDNSVTDPALAAPCPALIHLRDQFYHSSEDTPDKVSVDTLKRVGASMACYLHLCASMDEKEAREIAALCLDYAAERFKAEARAGLTCGKLDYLLKRETERLKSLVTLPVADLRLFEMELFKIVNALKGHPVKERHKEPDGLVKTASALIPVRRIFGPLTFDHIPMEKRRRMKFQPAWSGKWNLPLFWADGKRDLYEIYLNASMESGPYTLKDFIAYFRLLAKERLISLKRAAFRVK